MSGARGVFCNKAPFNLKPGLLSWLCRKTDSDNLVIDLFYNKSWWKLQARVSSTGTAGD